MATTLDIFQAALFLRTETESLSLLANTGEVPAALMGANWIFMEEDLIAYLKDKIRLETGERRQKTPCVTH